MIRTLVALSLAAPLLVAACGKTKIKDNPEHLATIDDLRQKLKDEQNLREILEKENAELKLGATTTDEETVVVRIDGDVLTIVAGKGKGPYAGEVKGNAKDDKLYEEFVKAVKRTRGSIKKCYQAALKKDSKIQARTISLTINVNYATSGRVTGTTFNPRISNDFDKCMDGVAQSWKLPAAPRKVAFQTKMSLTPE